MKVEHLKRYSAIARLLIKYGRTDLVQQMGSAGIPADMLDAADTRPPADPEELARDLEALGPTYIKLGQVLSTRADIISPKYMDALTRLQDHVEPFPFDQVKEIVEEELGVRLNMAFSAFEERPSAAASLAQVHRAALRDGRPVAVKVQRPGIRKIILEDLEAFDEITALFEKHTDLGRRYHIHGFVDTFRRTLLDELDFKREAGNLKRLSEIVADYDLLVVPLPVDDYSTSRVLTMDYIEGASISTINRAVLIEMDTSRMAQQLSQAYLDQIIVHGFVHADPHPGNVLVTPDGRLALIDVGMVGYLNATSRDRIIRLLLAIDDNKPEEAARILIELGNPLEGADLDKFILEATQIIQKNQTASIDEMKFGQVVMDMVRAGADNGVQPASDLAMTSKALLSLDQITRALDERVNPQQELRNYLRQIMSKRLSQQFSPSRLLTTFMDTYDLLTRLPGRVNQMFERLAQRDLELKIHIFDERALMANLQKIGNRIATGLVLAALIVGAALTMNIDSPVKVLGYPAISSFMFILAALLGFWMVIRILIEDRRDR
jgi:predicted unusual protein kinase regulating ubiquinone biosynthesis (AarF/ABC1/UbiB family)